MYDGVSVANGCRKCVMYLDKLSVGPSIADEIGLRGTPGLCVKWVAEKKWVCVSGEVGGGRYV